MLHEIRFDSLCSLETLFRKFVNLESRLFLIDFNIFTLLTILTFVRVLFFKVFTSILNFLNL